MKNIAELRRLYEAARAPLRDYGLDQTDFQGFMERMVATDRLLDALPALLNAVEAAKAYRYAGHHVAELEAKQRLDAALAAMDEGL